MPKASRWAVLKSRDLQTARAWRIKERLCWVRQARTERAAKRRPTCFLNLAKEWTSEEKLLARRTHPGTHQIPHEMTKSQKFKNCSCNPLKLQGLNSGKKSFWDFLRIHLFWCVIIWRLGQLRLRGNKGWFALTLTLS